MDVILIYILMLLIPIIASIKIKVVYSKYKKEKSNSGLTGYDVARRILDENGLKDMYIVEVKGNLTDCYDPIRKTVKLSTDVFHGDSIASISVAAHECGHAIQDKENYIWMRIRSFIYPVVRISTSIAYWVLLIGLILNLMNCIYLAIFLTAAGLLFQLITLPVEFDASRRANEILKSYNIVDSEEQIGVKKTLSSAAMTYVAGVISSALEILYLIMEFTDNR